MDQQPAFEVRRVDDNGGFEDVVVLGRMPETEDSVIAQDYADLWGRKVALTIVPDVDDGTASMSWQSSEIEVVKEVRHRSVTAAERRVILRRIYAWQSEEQFEAMQFLMSQFKL